MLSLSIINLIKESCINVRKADLIKYKDNLILIMPYTNYNEDSDELEFYLDGEIVSVYECKSSDCDLYEVNDFKYKNQLFEPQTTDLIFKVILFRISLLAE